MKKIKTPPKCCESISEAFCFDALKIKGTFFLHNPDVSTIVCAAATIADFFLLRALRSTHNRSVLIVFSNIKYVDATKMH